MNKFRLELLGYAIDDYSFILTKKELADIKDKLAQKNYNFTPIELENIKRLIDCKLEDYYTEAEDNKADKMLAKCIKISNDMIYDKTL